MQKKGTINKILKFPCVANSTNVGHATLNIIYEEKRFFFNIAKND